ncbi:hypothetical protein ABIC09_006743 [Bradyrhizobium sp. S3.12.5]|uniref:hypothetical protein n=1 Tax=Bradyrhizobium sp. S3.12.5 TaxID=3156386 RepID=UPI0033940B21
MLGWTFSPTGSGRREILELRQLDSGTLDKIARDLRVAPADLDTLVHQGTHAADELSSLLKVLGIDEADVSRSKPAVMRDMERVCSQCERKVQCNNDIEIGVETRDLEGYCLNAATMQAL